MLMFKSFLANILEATFYPFKKMHLLKLLVFFLAAFISLNAAETKPPRILVTVPAYRNFVKRVAGDTATVELMVPVGASAHTYEPTPKQVLEAGNADLWFVLGETFEKRALRALQGHNPRLQAIDLQQGLPVLEDSHHCSKCSHSGFDTHTWLSPRLARQQVDIIVAALQQRYPQNAAVYAQNGEALKKELQALDEEISQTLGDGSIKRLVIVSHPAYGYFGRDYGIVQLSVETEGKDPTPRQLTELLTKARKAGVRTVYTEPQYTNKGAIMIAKQLGAATEELDPYAEDYFGMMRRTSQTFSTAPVIQ